MPWELLPGTKPGLEPIIKKVTEAYDCERIVTAGIAELINATFVSPTLQITVVVGQAVYESITDEFTSHLEKNNIRILRSRHLRYDLIVVM
ncbi:hypothetical protein LCGC14_3001020 [marine sediment metagenome]|uniref:Uncharacterized protein n=1 Tax=marine sediment metagenome TaxID=412755 RepID=A0A0F8XNM4_9ZZZZ